MKYARILSGFVTSALLVSTAVAQDQLWVTQFGSSEHDIIFGIVPDSTGGAIVTGYTTGDLGGTGAGHEDAFIARHDSAGNQLWLRQLGTTTNHERGEAIASDGAGGAYVTGHTGGNLGGPNAGSGDLYLARYNGAGTQLWLTQIGSSVGDISYSVARVGGGVILGGATWSSWGATNAGRQDVLVTGFDSSGGYLWADQLGSSGDDSAQAATEDGNGGVFVAGITAGDLVQPSAGLWDSFIARYDGSGNRLWVRQFGSTGSDRAHALASDGAGGAFVAGRTNGNLGAVNAGSDDAFLARYDGAGNQLWVRQYGTPGIDWAYGLEPDGSGGVWVAGGSIGSLGAPNLGSYDAVLTRFDSSGNQLSIKQFGTNRAEMLYGVASDTSGGVFVGGYTEGELGAPSAGGGDVVLARFGDATCYADCDQSTGVGVLDVFDFLCFQDSFVNAVPYACDCDTSTGAGVCDVFDFLCFQDAFVGGCP